MRNIVVTLLLVLISSNALALRAGPYTITGRVKAFDTEKVVVDTGDSIIEIPRELIVAKPIAGKEIRVLLLPEQKEKLKIKAIKKK